MNKLSKVPTYNLKVVIRETGLKPDTLRAWERRYGLPVPERTTGGHRLYSEFDIESIKWLINRQKEGLRINRAVALWYDLIEAGQDPFLAYPQPGPPQKVKIPDIEVGETINEMRETWIVACLNFDEKAAEQILSQAFARYPLEIVCLDILSQGLAEIGDLWYTGNATVQQEHFASALIIRRLNAMLLAAPSPSRDKRILVACPPGEEHIISPLLISLLLRNRGWDVVYLGANVPVAQLETTIQSTQPHLVIMTAMTLQTSATLYQAAQSLTKTSVPLAFGGRIFNQHPDLRDLIPGSFLGESLSDAIDNIEYLVTSPSKVLVTKSVSEDYTRALDHFRDKHGAIETHIWENLSINDLKKYQLEIANDFLSRDITAGLILGNMDYLVDEIDWVKMLLINHDIPVELLPQYMDIYKKALNQNLDENGTPILTWINNLDLSSREVKS